ncbi:2-hydroxyacid dehydrogenase [Aeromicrobium sp.]|uniref:2-hydroxyacid dehydrogenase n=1 Tax=Aeromicrobium sp. TaxID=1871063 RepID=UPI003C45E47C
MTLRLSLPDERTLARFTDLADVEVVVWDFVSPLPGGGPIDLAVRPYVLQGDLGLLDPDRVRAVQSQTLGYDDAVGNVPDGITWCNAVGVHEGPAAEIAVGLLIAALRGFDQFARAMPEGRWVRGWNHGLLGSRVLLLGYGGIGTEIHARLDGFGVDLVRVARTARRDEHGDIHGIDEVPSLLPGVDAVVVAVPYGPETHHLLDDTFLAAMRPGALVVNVARGKVADTDALARHAASGHIRIASDVWDPEPLPPDHPLWTTPGVFVSPHVGGAVTTMHDRVEALVRDQVARLQSGRPLANVVDVSERAEAPRSPDPGR